MIDSIVRWWLALEFMPLKTYLSSPLGIGYLAVGLMLIMISLWSIAMPLAESIVASGTVNVTAQRRTIAHLEGGKIASLQVQEGDRVEAGQPLVSLDDQEIRSELDVLLYQRYARLAKIDRLLAERDQVDAVQFRMELSDEAPNDPQVTQLLDGELRNFSSRRNEALAKIALFSDRIAKAGEQKNSIRLQTKSLDRQLKIVRDQANNAQKLYEKGFGTKSTAIAFQREIEQLISRDLQIKSEINELNGIIEDSRLNKAIHQTEAAKSIEAEILAAQNEVAELDEKIDAIRVRLRNLIVRSPVAGVIVELQVTSASDIIKPASPILDILPADTSYRVEAHIPPTDIDGIVEGLPVEVRFPSFAGTQIPTITGSIIRVSADVLNDDNQQLQYYKILVSIDDWTEKSGEFDVIPGMPTEIIVRKKDRSILEYFLAPVTNHISRAVVG